MSGRSWRGAVLALGLAAMGAVGCASVGRDFAVEPVQQLEVGRTTHEDVASWFGKPWRTGYESGERTWTYADYRWSLFGGSTARDLVVRFDENGIVRSYTFNSTRPEDSQP